MYCKKCGGKVESYASNCPFCGEHIANNNVEAVYTSSEVKPTNRGVFKWILTYIVLMISPLNIIMLLIWAFGHKTDNDKTFKNWAKAQLIMAFFITIAASLLLVIYFPIIIEELEDMGLSLDSLLNL